MTVAETNEQKNQRLKLNLMKTYNNFDEKNVEGLVRAAVLVPIFDNIQGWEILYTRRSDKVQHHKGQVSFPGGTVEAQDTGPITTALREASEEINIDPAKVRISGFLPDVISLTNYVITPVVGLMDSMEDIRIRSDEVVDIFAIPVSFLADESNTYFEKRALPTGVTVEVPFYKKYNDRQVWGITAEITMELIRRIK